jgi:hypothetical protein
MGKNMVWDRDSYPAYNPVVYYGTLASSLIILSIAFFWPWAAKRRGGIADFACINLAATMASPLAWEHHYGILLPIFVWLCFGGLGFRSLGRQIETWEYVTLGLAFVLASNSIIPLANLGTVPSLTIFQAYLFLGALLTWLLIFRSKDDGGLLNQAAVAGVGR